MARIVSLPLPGDGETLALVLSTLRQLDPSATADTPLARLTLGPGGLAPTLLFLLAETGARPPAEALQAFEPDLATPRDLADLLDACPSLSRAITIANSTIQPGYWVEIGGAGRVTLWRRGRGQPARLYLGPCEQEAVAALLVDLAQRSAGHQVAALAVGGA